MKFIALALCASSLLAQSLPTGGIGANLEYDGGAYTVLFAYPGSPAEKAGLRHGDRLLAIDGVSIQAPNWQELQRRSRGAPGSSVTFKVERPGEKKALDVAIVRAELGPVPDASSLKKLVFHEIERGADKGIPFSEYKLGKYYADEEHDEERAFRWLLKAAEAGNVNAQSRVAQSYKAGIGTKKNGPKALEWAYKATGGGDGAYLWNYAAMLSEGTGGRADPQAAFRWYRASAEKGFSPAYCTIAELLYKGIGVPPNFDAAMQWARKADNLACGQVWLGYFYETGQGVAKDMVEAYKWYSLAAAGGDKDTLARRNRAAAALTPAQLIDGQRRAADYKPSAARVASAEETASPALSAASSVDAPDYKRPEDPDAYALIIGVESYKKLPKADFAEADATAMRRHLLALGYPERNVISLLGPDATNAQLAAYLEEWLPKNTDKSSRVFVYYSGHGAPDPASGDAYLVPWDGDAMFLKSTAYPLRRFFDSLQKLPARSVVVALDSCFSGAGGRSVLARGMRPLVTRLAANDTGRLTVFAAASGDQTTGTLETQRHGDFTYHFLEGLAAAGRDPSRRLAARALFDYLKPRVEDDARRQNRIQTPTFSDPLGAEIR